MKNELDRTYNLDETTNNSPDLVSRDDVEFETTSEQLLHESLALSPQCDSPFSKCVTEKSLPELTFDELQQQESADQIQQNNTGADAHLQAYRAHCQTAVENLGYRNFRTRQEAQRTLENRGMTSLPLLGRAISNGDLEVSSRAQLTVRTILGRATAQELVSCRDTGIARTVASAQTGNPSDSDLEFLTSQVNSELARRFSAQTFQHSRAFLNKDFDTPFTESLFRELDQVSTPAGQRLVTARIREVETYLASPQLSADEREGLTRERQGLSHLSNQDDLTTARLNVRLVLSQEIENPGQVALEAWALCRTQHQRRNVVERLICQRDVDLSPGWIDRFAAIDIAQNGEPTGREMITAYRRDQ